jgi:uncharacterized protein
MKRQSGDGTLERPFTEPVLSEWRHLARGREARPDSDYDVAVFLKALDDRWGEADRIANIATEIMDRTGAFIHAMPYPAGTYRDRTPLMHEVRREGIDL